MRRSCASPTARYAALASPKAVTQARLRSSAGTAAMIPAGITARSHPGFSWSAGPTRSRWARRRMRNTSGGTRGQPRRPAAGQLRAIGDLRGMRLAESVRGSGMLGWFCCWARCWAEAGCRTRHPRNARSAAPLAPRPATPTGSPAPRAGLLYVLVIATAVIVGVGAACVGDCWPGGGTAHGLTRPRTTPPLLTKVVRAAPPLTPERQAP